MKERDFHVQCESIPFVIITVLLGIMDKIQAILEMIASNGQNSGCFFV